MCWCYTQKKKEKKKENSFFVFDNNLKTQVIEYKDENVGSGPCSFNVWTFLPYDRYEIHIKWRTKKFRHNLFDLQHLSFELDVKPLTINAFIRNGNLTLHILTCLFWSHCYCLIKIKKEEFKWKTHVTESEMEVITQNDRKNS